MESSDVVLQTTGLTLGYGQQTVLRDVNLEIRSGEFWFVLGPNGGGKTTLLRALLGLLPPQAGHIRLHPERGCRERIGFVPQRCELNPTLPVTVREFVLLGLVGLPVRQEGARERLRWALEKTGLANMANHSYWALSGGQRQRALVARALVRRPTLLILDEPTNNLDVATEEALLQTLTTLNHHEQHTLLFVTHNLLIATRYATHAALLIEGTALAGPRQTVLTERNLAQVYGLTTSEAVDQETRSAIRHAASGEPV